MYIHICRKRNHRSTALEYQSECVLKESIAHAVNLQ